MGCRAIQKSLFGLWPLFFAALFSPAVAVAQYNPLLPAQAYNNLPWSDFVRKAEAEYPLRFFYSDEWFAKNAPVKFRGGDALLADVLDDYLKGSAIVYSADRWGNLFFENGEPLQTRLSPGFFSGKTAPEQGAPAGAAPFLETSSELVSNSVAIGNEKTGARERSSTISGYITDAGDGSPVPGATFLLVQTGTGTATDESGFFKIQLKKGTYTVEVSSLNHETKKFELLVLSSGTLDLTLVSRAFVLSSVVVSSDRYNNVSGSQMGFENLAVRDVRSIPMVLGEGDVLKVAQLLPGVQSVGEGASGFNVRGSPADQNLFYIDNIPIYNTSHFLGFFSVFNSDAIRGFSLLKSNIPAQYGGRLASIFEVQSKTGNRQKFALRGGISPITGKIQAEGPIVKDKASFLLSLRSTYSDWVLKLVRDENIKNSSASFADVLANVTVDLDENNQLKLLGYFSTDDTDLAGSFHYFYENRGGSINWRRFFKGKHSLDVDLVHASYRSANEDEQFEFAAYRQRNNLEHNAINASFTLRPGARFTGSAGGSASLYRVNKGSLSPLGEKSQIQLLDLGDEQGLESALFAQAEWVASPSLTLNAGLRYNIFSYLGPAQVFFYEAGRPKNEQTVADTLAYGNFEPVATYRNPDFRAGARWKIHDALSLKASYNSLHQYLFLLSNTVALAPSDRWKLVDPHIGPMRGDQFSLGLYSALPRFKLEFSAEGYYKKVANQAEFREGANLLVSEAPEWDVLPGNLNAWGVEFMLKKPKGALNGWVNYTYSTTSVLVDIPATGEQINFGKPYPSNYDKPHSLNLVANYRFSRRFEVSFNFVYSTGRPVTYPAGAYFLDGYHIIHYSERNEYRIPDYMRIDLSARLEGNLSAKKAFHGTWIFSVYNAVGRRNAYSVYFLNENNSIKGYKLSIFGAPIFSVSYQFKTGSYEE